MIVTRGLGGYGLVIDGLGALLGVSIPASSGDSSETTTAEGYGDYTTATFEEGTVFVYQGERTLVLVADGSEVALYDLETKAPLTYIGTEVLTKEGTTTTLGAKTGVIITTGGN